MDYISTRGTESYQSHCAILKGIADDGGLFVPSSFPSLKAEDIDRLADLDYAARATFVLGSYLTDFDRKDILKYATSAAERFEDNDPAPLVKLDDTLYMLELWHGPTSAFKDVALTTLPYLLTGSKAMEKESRKVLILVATSGDTGKAALEGFKNVEGTEVVVVYPKDGVSNTQRLQMLTADGDNVHVLGIDGNFDDAQTAVKAFFADADCNKALADRGYVLSSANSINFGRLVPQITYYISAYCDLVAAGEIDNGDKVNFVVPSGNFGNILAGYYAKRMGLPIKNLIIGSNSNNILTDFWNTGVYDTKREFIKTMSPSMDILVSSNLERLLFEVGDRDPEFVKSLMKDLKTTGKFSVPVEKLREKAPEFMAFYASEQETLEEIEEFYEDYDYVLDPHTAVAVNCYYKYFTEHDDYTKTVVVSTANPYKFPSAVYEAIEGKSVTDTVKAAKALVELTGMEMPANLKDLESKEIKHNATAKRTEIKEGILAFFNN